MGDNGSGSRHSAFWRGDLAQLWVFLAVFIGLNLALAMALETHIFAANFLGWLIMAGALIVSWIIPVVVLIPRTARTADSRGTDDIT